MPGSTLVPNLNYLHYNGPATSLTTLPAGWINVGYTTEKRTRKHHHLICLNPSGLHYNPTKVVYEPAGSGQWYVLINGQRKGEIYYKGDAWSGSSKNTATVKGFKTRRHAAVFILESLNYDWEIQ